MPACFASPTVGYFNAAARAATSCAARSFCAAGSSGTSGFSSACSSALPVLLKPEPSVPGVRTDALDVFVTPGAFDRAATLVAVAAGDATAAVASARTPTGAIDSMTNVDP